MKNASIKNIVIASLIGLSVFIPGLAQAATFVISPDQAYSVGDTMYIPVAVNPEGTTIYTASLNANFTPDTFTVKSFTINDAWLPLKQPGYDALDNNSGNLIKTGGYPGGISSLTNFGTITGKAMKAGAASFTVNANSIILDSNNANKLTGSRTIAFAIKPAVSRPVRIPVNSNVKSTTTQATSSNANSNIAAAEATIPLSLAIWILAAVIIIAGIVIYFVNARHQIHPGK